MTETRFDVGMTCEGCASAVKRILGKIDGVNDVQTDVAAKTVVVQADPSVSPQLMLEKLQKWSAASGKSVALAAA
jgi:copper chaperone